MKFVVLLVTLTLCAGSVFADSPDVKTYKMRTSKSHLLNNCEIDIDDGSLIVEKRGRRGVRMEITADYELIVDNKLIETTDEQQKFVKETYDGSMKLLERAKEIGLEGASIGIEGAKLGMKAVGGVFKMMFTAYDHEDLEDDMEHAADKLEKRADKLERRADKLEIIVEDLEFAFDQLIDLTPELEPLR